MPVFEEHVVLCSVISTANVDSQWVGLRVGIVVKNSNSKQNRVKTLEITAETF